MTDASRDPTDTSRRSQLLAIKLRALVDEHFGYRQSGTDACDAEAFASGAAAQEFLTTETALNDDHFYNLVACAAPPAGACGKDIVRWQKTALSIGITKMDSVYLGGKKKRAEAALTRAIAEINASGSAIQLKRNDDTPDIPILFLDIPARGTIQKP